MNKNKVGLVVGVFLAIMHAIWMLSIMIMPATIQTFMNWIFILHALEPILTITSIQIVNACLLVIVAFVAGYVYGWVFAALWNWIVKK